MIRTERLVLRKPTAADVEDPPPFLLDPRVMDFLGGVEDDPRGVVQNWLDGWAKYLAGKFIVETAAASGSDGSASTSTTQSAGPVRTCRTRGRS